MNKENNRRDYANMYKQLVGIISRSVGQMKYSKVESNALYISYRSSRGNNNNSKKIFNIVLDTSRQLNEPSRV